MAKQNSNIDMAIADLKKKSAQAYTIKTIKHSVLMTMLDRLSKKSEEQLTKSDLLNLIKANCEYMKSLNIYNYLSSEYVRLRFGVNNDGKLDNANRKD